LKRLDIPGLIAKALQEEGLPAVAESKAKPPMLSVARIELIPQIASTDDGGLDCASLVSILAESEATVHIPPVDAPRSVTILYWHEGAMAASGQSVHGTLVSDMLHKMALEFVTAYKRAQPNPADQ
jgi:hypothetical protein